jgi:hypothetical protein
MRGADLLAGVKLDKLDHPSTAPPTCRSAPVLEAAPAHGHTAAGRLEKGHDLEWRQLRRRRARPGTSSSGGVSGGPGICRHGARLTAIGSVATTTAATTTGTRPRTAAHHHSGVRSAAYKRSSAPDWGWRGFATISTSTTTETRGMPVRAPCAHRRAIDNRFPTPPTRWGQMRRMTLGTHNALIVYQKGEWRPCHTAPWRETETEFFFFFFFFFFFLFVITTIRKKVK